MKVFIVVNEGSIVFASKSEDAAEGFREDAIIRDRNAEIEESGRDIDDLTPEELAEFEYISGYNGGCYTSECINIKDADDDDTEYVTSDCDTFTKYDIIDALNRSSHIREYDDCDEDCDDNYDEY